jgi:membrane-bound inhibitor of C-type lysozyme
MRHALLALLVISLAGCTSITPAPPQVVNYRCDAGRSFSVTQAASGDTAIIDISGMRFALQAEPTSGPGQRHGCGQLTLWRDGASARVEMEASALYENCRRQEHPADSALSTVGAP